MQETMEDVLQELVGQDVKLRAYTSDYHGTLAAAGDNVVTLVSQGSRGPTEITLRTDAVDAVFLMVGAQ